MEQGTPFYARYTAGKLVVPDENAAADLYAVTQEVCDAAGIPAYEISNHAQPGAECRHNLAYWRYAEYAGIGPGAHGRLKLADGRHATATEKNPEDWRAKVESWGDGLVVDDLLTPEEEGDEYLLMGLRLAEGIDVDRYRTLSGRGLDPARLRDLLAHGMVERAGTRLKATRAGFSVLDAVVADLAA
jgi:oxygen-independent coproporphyrinogen-3 oxidase